MMKKPLVILLVLTALLLFATAALAYAVPNYQFAGPVFGLEANRDGSLVATDAAQGIVELRQGSGNLIAELPGASDIAPLGRGTMFAITGLAEPDNELAQKLYRVSRGKVREIADLGEFENEVNPDGVQPPDSNPYGVAALSGGKVLVADAGGNSLLIVDQRGNIDWVATLPEEVVSTDHLKSLAGCPAGPGFVCGLPDEMPAQAVATSVAVGPDGAYYVSELKGFPAPVGESRVWRIEPGTRHAACGTSPACSVVLDGLTSIVDLNFGPDGTLYVVEFDEATWAAVEIFGAPTGGTVNACDVVAGSCTEVATGLNIVSAVAVDKRGNLYAAVDALLPSAHIVELP